MARMMKLALIFGVFLSSLSAMALTGCSASSESAIPTIDGMSPGEYQAKLAREQQQKAKSAKKVKKHHRY
jgi:hypothetical protein